MIKFTRSLYYGGRRCRCHHHHHHHVIVVLLPLLLMLAVISTAPTTGVQGCDLASLVSSSPSTSSSAIGAATSSSSVFDDEETEGQRRRQRHRILQDGNSTSTSTSTSSGGSNSTSSSNNTVNTSTCVVDPSSPVAIGTGLGEVDIKMVARQTRGRIRIDNNCQFTVSQLEIYVDPTDPESTSDIIFDWYGALSLDPNDVANATKLVHENPMIDPSSSLLHGNTTLSFETLYDLTGVGAILLVERPRPQSGNEQEQEGYDNGNDNDNNDQPPLPPFTILGQVLIQKLVPGPAKDLLEAQPTMFDNCWTVSDTARIRWSIIEQRIVEVDDVSNTTDSTTASTYYIDVGLEYTVPFGLADDTWMAFGPAAPGVQDRLMGGSDVVVAGFRSSSSQAGDDDDDDDEPTPFADDYYIAGYDVCTELPSDRELPYDGVCRDSVWTNSNNDGKDDDLELLYAHVKEGVAFVRYRRPLVVSSSTSTSTTTTSLPAIDHDIVLGGGMTQHFVWARGPLDPTKGIAEVQFHGYQFGQLKDLDMNKTTWTCPPLMGVQLDGEYVDDDDDPLLDDDDDEFAAKFEFRTMLEGGVVEVFWTSPSSEDEPSSSSSDEIIHIGARANVRGSTWLSIAVGDTMTDAWAWVATTPAAGEVEMPKLLAYRMDGLDASTVRLLSEDENVLFAGPSNVELHDGGFISFEVVAPWPLPGMSVGDTSAPLIWAIGPSWSTEGETPKREDEHSVRSKASTRIDFATGTASAGKETSNAIMLAHGAIMWIAWLVLAPLTGIASRFIRDDQAVPEWLPLWIVLHKRLAMAVLVLSLIGLVLAVVAVSDAGLSHILSSHAKIGVTVLCLLVVQNFLGMQRPSPNGSTGLHKRRLWEYQHRIFAVAMLVLAIASVITGSIRLEDFDSTTRYGVQLTIAWIVVVVVLFVIYEIRRTHVKKAAEVPVPVVKTADDEEQCDDDIPGKIETPPISPWLGTWRIVYVFPAVVGLLALIAMTAVTFTDPASPSQVSSSSTASSSASSTEPPASPEAYIPSTADVPQGCLARPQSYIGDGWCDDHTPYNTEECGWDGGDCCDINAQLYNCRDPNSTHFGKSSPKGWPNPLPIPRNPRYDVEREHTFESWVISYNNYYEFGLSKDVVEEANKHAEFLAPEDWFVDVSGLVENPMTIDVKALISQMHLEERLYRHRCVEAWSITSQWVGFPLTKLLDMVGPNDGAEIVRFTSWKDFKHSTVQETSNYPWPYTEALTMDEARNELTMVTVGAFGKPLAPQSGAPIRLNIPWKYGFKSIKSFQKIEFLPDDEESDGSRRTFWSTQNGREYGFYANVNPDVPHPRWSQATERHFITGHPGTRLDTTRMNGYQEQVDYMYDDLGDPTIYF